MAAQVSFQAKAFSSTSPPSLHQVCLRVISSSKGTLHVFNAVLTVEKVAYMYY